MCSFSVVKVGDKWDFKILQQVKSWMCYFYNVLKHIFLQNILYILKIYVKLSSLWQAVSIMGFTMPSVNYAQWYNVTGFLVVATIIIWQCDIHMWHLKKKLYYIPCWIFFFFQLDLSNEDYWNQMASLTVDTKSSEKLCPRSHYGHRMLFCNKALLM